MRKEIMKESHRDRSVALYSRKKVVASESDSEPSEESDDDAALFVKRSGNRFDRRQSISRRYPTRHDHSPAKPLETQWRRENEAAKRIHGEKGECFNCGSTDHYARDCKEKKSSGEDYDSMRQSTRNLSHNLSVKTLISKFLSLKRKNGLNMKIQQKMKERMTSASWRKWKM